MIKGGRGGKIPARHGLRFERRMSLAAAVSRVPGYKIKNDRVLFGGKHVATLYKKHMLYSKLLKPSGVDYRTILSKKLVPDDAILVLVEKTMFIIEIKFQTVSGSVDEKLQTCDFKLKQYSKLLGPHGLKVRYVYVLNDWFRHESYRDVLQYVRSVGCDYFFHEVPLKFLGLPTI